MANLLLGLFIFYLYIKRVFTSEGMSRCVLLRNKETVYLLYVLLYTLFIITKPYSSSNYTVLHNKGLHPVYQYVKAAAIAER